VRLAPLLLALSLVAFAPSPAAAAGNGVATDMLVDVVDADHVYLEETLTETAQHFSPWTLPIPDNATVVEAHDAKGFLSNTTNADGTVTVRTRTAGVSLPYSFTLTFLRPAEEYGSLLHVLAQASGNPGDESSLHVRLPAGWTLAGVDTQPEVAPDAQGLYVNSGPISGGFAFLPPGVADPGPDPRASGTGLLRAGDAMLTETGGTLTLTLVYDTDVYGQVGVPVPPGLTVLSASTPFGPLLAAPSGGRLDFHHAYPAHAGLGARPITVSFALPPPTLFGGAFLNATINMAAGQDDNLTLDVHLGPGLTRVSTRTTAAVDSTGLRMSAHEPFVAEIAYLPAAPSGWTRFAVGTTYVVQVPDLLVSKARVVAQNASDLLPQVSAFAGGARIDRPFFLTYAQDESIFGLFTGEEGFYSGGLNAISIRASDLDNTTATTPDFQAVSTLVHETTHGLVDRMVPEGYGNLSFFQEGLARLAEQHLETRFPDKVVSCHAGTCTRLSIRPDPAEVQARYQSGATFPITWSASHAGGDLGFLYDDSGLVFRAYEERSDPQALGRALITLALRGAGPDDDAEAQAVVDALVKQSPGMTERSLLYPGLSVASLPAKSFEACLGDLARPPFPGEAPGPRPADCGDLPTATTESADAGPVPPHGENFTLPSPPTPVTPTVKPTTGGGPTPVPLPTDSAPTGEVPGGQVEPSAKVPAPALPLVAALVVGLALLARRRR